MFIKFFKERKLKMQEDFILVHSFRVTLVLVCNLSRVFHKSINKVKGTRLSQYKFKLNASGPYKKPTKLCKTLLQHIGILPNV